MIRFPLKLAENDDVGETDLRVINARKKAFSVVPKASPRRPNHVTMCLHVTLGSRCKMANSCSEDETDILPERPTRIQPYQFEPARQDFGRVPVGIPWGLRIAALTAKVLATQMGVMRRSKKVRSFELYKFNPF